jgi:predicted phosphoribosyltransferase
LDVVLVHKLSHPESPELAIGAIDESGKAFVSEWAADLDPKVP